MTDEESISNNQNSRRAFSRKNRVYVFREFLFETYNSETLFSQTTSKYRSNSNNCNTSNTYTVLDVAGGKGDLSWLLQNVDGISSIVLDPCFRTTTNLVRSVHWLQTHPEEAQRRANPTRMESYQPLAALFLDQIRSTQQQQLLQFQEPQHLTLSMNDRLVTALHKSLHHHSKHQLGAPNDDIANNYNNYNNNNNNYSSTTWKEYFQQELHEHVGIFLPGSSNKNELMVMVNTSTDMKPRTTKTSSSFQQNTILNAQEAIQVFQTIQLIVGFHPDQATESSLDLAIQVLKIPVCIVPCCVFPSEFSRRQYQSQPVQNYSQFIAYLQHKYPILRTAVLSFPNTTTSRNIVLYTLPQDVPNYRFSL